MALTLVPAPPFVWENLNWFQAFGRTKNGVVDIPAVFDVLINGPLPHPRPNLAPGNTGHNEKHLGLNHCTYVYLGKGQFSFGDIAFAMAFEGFQGDASPFDTGGTVGRYLPVSTFPQVEKQKFVNDYTFSPAQLKELGLDLYPSKQKSRIRDYLRDVTPSHSGPEDIWKKSVGPIWANKVLSKADGRIHRWEGRYDKQILLKGYLLGWAAEINVYQAMVDHAATLSESAYDDADAVLQLYQEEDVAVFFDEYVKRQEATI